MARIKIKERVLEALGFARVELEDGVYFHALELAGGYHMIYYTDGIVELMHKGYSVPLNCRSEKHLKTLIEIL